MVFTGRQLSLTPSDVKAILNPPSPSGLLVGSDLLMTGSGPLRGNQLLRIELHLPVNVHPSKS